MINDNETTYLLTIKAVLMEKYNFLQMMAHHITKLGSEVA